MIEDGRVMKLVERWREGVMPRQARSMRQFAEDEIIYPKGPRKGEHYDAESPSWSGLVLDAFSRGEYRRYFGTGSVQSGKTFLFVVIPCLYHLFEMGEDVGLGAPTITMSLSVYRDKILPVIEASRFRRFLPKSGGGSKGGMPQDGAIRFANGASLRFFGAGGGDAQRSSHTVRVMIVTEIDKMDEAGDASRETNPVRQLEARTVSFGDRARIYAECTVSIEEGMVWQEVTVLGTGHAVHMRCRHCEAYVYPDREHLTGWQEAETIVDAREMAGVVCPACGAIWSDADRRHALRDCRLAARTQEWKDGELTGEPPRVTTMGVRWNALQSSMVAMADVAEAEYRARLTDRPDDERELCQFWWVVPYRSDVADVRLDREFLLKKKWKYGHGETPKEVKFTIAAVDVQKKSYYWLVDGYGADLSRYPLDWGMLDIVPLGEDRHPTEMEVRAALDEIRDRLREAYNYEQLWVDCGYNPALTTRHIVREWCHGQGGAVYAMVGRSEGQYKSQRVSGKTLPIPQGVPDMLAPRLQPDGSVLWFLDVDRLKDDVHARLLRDCETPGCHYLPRDIEAEERYWYVKHLLGEKRQVTWEPGKGEVRTWVAIKRRHDLLDCSAYTLAGAYLTRAILEESAQGVQAPPHKTDARYISSIRSDY